MFPLLSPLPLRHFRLFSRAEKTSLSFFDLNPSTFFKKMWPKLTKSKGTVLCKFFWENSQVLLFLFKFWLNSDVFFFLNDGTFNGMSEHCFYSNSFLKSFKFESKLETNFPFLLTIFLNFFFFNKQILNFDSFVWCTESYEKGNKKQRMAMMFNCWCL